VVESDGTQVLGAQALLGWGSWRAFQRYQTGHHSTWAGWVWEGPSWGLQALAGYGVEDHGMGRLALTVHDFHGESAYDQGSPQFSVGWRAWEATPPAAAPPIPE
jgi:hypothetical protein